LPCLALPWYYFYDGFLSIINRHAPFKRFRVKGRDNPWFSEALSVQIRERHVAWAKARQSDVGSDWIRFRQLGINAQLLLEKQRLIILLKKKTLSTQTILRSSGRI